VKKIKRGLGVDSSFGIGKRIKIFQATPESALQVLPEKYLLLRVNPVNTYLDTASVRLI